MKIDNEFIGKYDRLVRLIVNRFNAKGIDKKDLLQEGRIGLMEAAKKYDESSGVEFSSYASWWIRKYVGQCIIQMRNTIVIPERTGEQYVLKKRSIDDVYMVEDDDCITYAEVIVGGEDPEQMLIAKERRLALMESVQLATMWLSKRERIVLDGLYGLTGSPMSVAELAKREGTSCDRIRRVHERAIRKLKEQLVEK